MKRIIRQLQEELFEIFSYLHTHPEVSWQEWNTSRWIKEQLETEGLRTKTFPDCPGVVGEWGDGPLVVGLRADLDALYQEVDGTWRANHSCGHDAHMTMVLGAVKVLRRLWDRPPGKIMVLFQPAEETGEGALKMVEKGILDGVDFLYGVHLRPIQELASGYAAPGIRHGAAQFITGEIHGTSAHAAQPHLGVNAIEVGASFLQEIAHIHVNPQIPASIKMTRFYAGEKNANIIPDRAEFALDLRAQSNEGMEQMVMRVQRIADAVSLMYGANIQLHFGARVAAATIDEQARSLMEQAICDVLGRERCKPVVITSGGEDFHFYALQKPELKSTMLALGCDLHPGLHHPQMTFNRKDLWNGIEILATVVAKTFQHTEEWIKKGE